MCKNTYSAVCMAVNEGYAARLSVRNRLEVTRTFYATAPWLGGRKRPFLLPHVKEGVRLWGGVDSGTHHFCIRVNLYRRRAKVI